MKSWEVEEEKGVDDCWQRSWPEGAKQMPFKYLHFSNSINKEVEEERGRRRRRVEEKSVVPERNQSQQGSPREFPGPHRDEWDIEEGEGGEKKKEEEWY